MIDDLNARLVTPVIACAHSTRGLVGSAAPPRPSTGPQSLKSRAERGWVISFEQWALALSFMIPLSFGQLRCCLGARLPGNQGQAGRAARRTRLSILLLGFLLIFLLLLGALTLDVALLAAVVAGHSLLPLGALLGAAQAAALRELGLEAPDLNL